MLQETLALVGRVLVGVAVASWLCGAGLVLADDSNTGANFGVASILLAAGVAVIGFLLRKRVRLAREAMFVGLAALGGWFLVFFYALGNDTP